MNILIAGATGQIGQFLNKNLKNNYKVTSLGKSNIKESNYSIDLLDTHLINNFLVNIKTIDVLVFLVSNRNIHSIESDHHLNNFQTLVNLMESLHKSNKTPSKVIFTSTSHIYGMSDRVKIYDENTNPNPMTFYSRTKLNAEQYLLKNYPSISYILRLSPVYSEKMVFNLERRVFLNKIPFIVGDGKTRFSLCNINNLLSSINGIINEKVPVGVYNLSDLAPYSYLDLHKFFLRRNPKSFTIKIPKKIVKLSSVIFQKSNKQYLYETSRKLIIDNIFISKKLNQYVDLNYNLNDLEI